MVGSVAGSERYWRSEVVRQPLKIRPRIYLAATIIKRASFRLALAALSEAVNQDPNSFRASLLLANVQRNIGDSSAAAATCKKTLEQHCGSATAYRLLGLCTLDLGNLPEAEEVFRAAISYTQDVPELYAYLGWTLSAQRRHREAIPVLSQALALDPNSIGILFQLSSALMAEFYATEAAQCARRILCLDPKSAHGRNLLAQALLTDNLGDQAMAEAKLATELGPKCAHFHADYAAILLATGRTDKSRKEAEQALKLDPTDCQAHFTLLTGRKITEADRDYVNKIADFVAECHEPMGRADLLHYGLGKALEDLGEYEQSIGHYNEANRFAYHLKFGDMNYNVADEDSAHKYIQTSYHRSVDMRRDFENSSELPIFIVGMPRSGTTLVHQILTSHPDIAGAGELTFWPRLLGTALDPETGAIDPRLMSSHISQYISKLSEIAPGSRLAVDKMPSNYFHLGQLQLAFPNARFFHVQRDPVDTCFSIFATQNGARLAWAHNKENIAHYYQSYLDLMAFWEKTLDWTRVFEVRYEDLVSQAEEKTREMIDFCGVPWHDVCLNPEKNESPVNTPSRWQVRQPIYKSSVARWRKFEPWIQEFAHLSDGRQRGSG